MPQTQLCFSATTLGESAPSKTKKQKTNNNKNPRKYSKDQALQLHPWLIWASEVVFLGEVICIHVI